MNEIYEKIKYNPLFSGIDAGSFDKMISCMEGKIKTYQPREWILLAGEPVSTIGIIVGGSVQILRESADGKQNLMAELHESERCGEVFACAGVAQSPVSVTSMEDCKVLYLNYRKIITLCPSTCPFHAKLIENMLTLIAQKTLLLNQKIEILSKRTIRERLMLYFGILSKGASRITIPFSREELAAYLCVDRSAMSAELSQMQKDGLIRYHRNEVQLLPTPKIMN